MVTLILTKLQGADRTPEAFRISMSRSTISAYEGPMNYNDGYRGGSSSSGPPDRWEEIRRSARLAANVGGRTERFALYDYLGSVYLACRKWKTLGIARKKTEEIARHFGVRSRTHWSPTRIVIAATFPEAGPKQHSRWVRALQYAFATDTPPGDIKRLFRSNGGVSGCARLAASRKRWRRLST
jgi:hypothetical protein